MPIEVWAASRLLFSRTEVALLLNLSERSVDYLVSGNRLNSIKKGRRRLFTRDAVLNFAGVEVRDRMVV
jgi:excisionase family DNA binding protein